MLTVRTGEIVVGLVEEFKEAVMGRTGNRCARLNGLVPFAFAARTDHTGILLRANGYKGVTEQVLVSALQTSAAVYHWEKPLKLMFNSYRVAPGTAFQTYVGRSAGAGLMLLGLITVGLVGGAETDGDELIHPQVLKGPMPWAFAARTNQMARLWGVDGLSEAI